MRPVAIVQHDPSQRAGFLRECLNGRGVRTLVFTPEEGDALPRVARDFSGLVLLGSNRSVNDDLPWIRDERRLVHRALADGVPVLGHCFGAQMLARCLGGSVARHACANIGWQDLAVTPEARSRFGVERFVAFNWHYESFSIPPGARRILIGRHCLNKGFALGPHLGFQCHLEVTEDIVRDWCAAAAPELAAAGGPGVQHGAVILAQMREALPALHAVARRVYGLWISRLVEPSMPRQAVAG
jgi:GMP synthase-like glutamine amidotransferase